jgi:hypothetical protein
MSFDQLPSQGASGEWCLEELYRAWRVASTEADDAYANWTRSLAHSDYDAYVAATDRANAAVAALAAEQLRRRRKRRLRGVPSPADVAL